MNMHHRMLAKHPSSGETRADHRAALKRALMGLGGTSIEWYDFYIYGTAAALVFPAVFFPGTLPPFVALMASFSTFAVGFLARPVGAALFGHIGDRTGRNVALALALITMGSATTLIGCLPSYRSVGVFSPVALVILRFVQGLAIGGQWGGAMLLATENAPKSKRGLYGSFAQVGVPVGVVLANLALLIASSTTSPEEFLEYGWRVPFLISISVVAFGVFVLARVKDSSVFLPTRQEDSATNTSLLATTPLPLMESSDRERFPVLIALRMYPRQIFLAAGAFVAANLMYYILITYVVAYGSSAAGLHLSRSTMLTAVLAQLEQNRLDLCRFQ